MEALESRIAPAVFLVENLLSDGPGSLRDAIAQANATPALDTISFAKSLEGFISLAPNGEIAITAPLKIVGPGADKITISGVFQSRVFNIDDGSAETDSPVTISNLHFSESMHDVAGGAINSAESLTLVNVSVSRSEAFNGGAISVTGDNLVLKNCRFWKNEAYIGGAVFADCQSIQITNTVVGDNYAQYQGGGVHLDTNSSGSGTPKIRIERSSFTGNNTVFKGGGLEFATLADGTKVSIKDCVISNNMASNNVAGSEGVGGGIFIENGQVSIERTAIAANYAFQSGGGIHDDGADSLLIRGCMVTGNYTGSGSDGGAGLFAGTSVHEVKIVSSEFSGNRTFGSGAAIRADDGVSLIVQRSIVTDNLATSAYGGGGISVDGHTVEGSLTIIASLIARNSTYLGGGGGVFTDGDVNVLIKGSRIFDNSAAHGGGLELLDSTVTITGSVISRNVALGPMSDELGEGGGLFLRSPSVPAQISNTRILDNIADDDGGGIFVDGGLRLIGGLVSGNGAEGGGGIYSIGGSLQLEGGVKVIRNSAFITPNIAQVL